MLQPNSTLAPTAVNATIGNANPLGRVSAVQPFAVQPGCVPTVYDLLKNNRNATTFLRLANLTGDIQLPAAVLCSTCLKWNS